MVFPLRRLHLFANDGNRLTMDVVLAQTFMTVLDTGNFVAAARRLNVTQSTVSARIKSLEDSLGHTLFERSKSGARLTPAGVQFRRHAATFLRVWQHARLEVGLAEAHRSHLTVTAQMSLWDAFLLVAFGHLRRAHPDLALTGRIADAGASMQALNEGTADLAIQYRPVHPPGIAVEHLFDDGLVLVTSRARPQDQPAAADYVFVNWGPEFAADHAQSFPELANTGLHLDLGVLGVSYLLQNYATGYFPERTVAPLIEAGQIAVVPGSRRFTYPVFAAYPDVEPHPLLGLVLEALRAQAAAVEAARSEPAGARP